MLAAVLTTRLRTLPVTSSTVRSCTFFEWPPPLTRNEVYTSPIASCWAISPSLIDDGPALRWSTPAAAISGSAAPALQAALCSASSALQGSSVQPAERTSLSASLRRRPALGRTSQVHSQNRRRMVGSLLSISRGCAPPGRTIQLSGGSEHVSPEQLREGRGLTAPQQNAQRNRGISMISMMTSKMFRSEKCP
eukprot:COSAG03_NODE_289_length_9347_cov_501.073814_3_plen_193_part_00